MRNRQNKGSAKILFILLIVSAFSFTLTGIAENIATNSLGVIPVMLSTIKNIGGISAELVLPVVNVIPDEKTESVDSKPEQETEPDSSTNELPSQTMIQTEVTKPESEPESIVDVETFQPSFSRLITYNISKAKDDTYIYNNKDGVIENHTYTPITGDRAINLQYGQINNFTELSKEDILSVCERKPEIKIEISPLNEPQVLIMHTHTTESYEPTGDGYYDEEYEGRSLSPVNSVVGVGAVIASELAEKGITVIHDGMIFDDPLYSNSYSRSYDRVKEILKEYPSIKIVLDIHRDGIEYDGVRVAPVTEINGKEAAQMMIICGCDDGTGILPQYEENLKLAAYLQSSIEEKYPTLTRPVLFDYRYYNQDLTTGSLLIEIGTHGNTAEQAKYTAELIGEEIALSLLRLSK
jgi:stage II sporulation protein P